MLDIVAFVKLLMIFLIKVTQVPCPVVLRMNRVLRVDRITFFLLNRVEQQKRTQTTTCWPFGSVFAVQLGLSSADRH